jgi:hypothetical protein
MTSGILTLKNSFKRCQRNAAKDLKRVKRDKNKKLLQQKSNSNIFLPKRNVA